MKQGPLAPVTDVYGRLLGVRPDESDGFVWGLRFVFEGGCLDAVVDPDWDTLDLALSTSSEADVAGMQTDGAWAPFVGRSVRWVWLLRNQREFSDGAQLEFTGEGSPALQLMAAASAIWLYRVVPADTPGRPG